MLVLVINLDRAADRLAHMEREFARLGVDFTRLAATDGRTLSAAEAVETREGRPLSNGEIACFVSHRRCWQALLDSGDSHAIVLEDDVFLGAGAGDLFHSADWFPKEAGLVKLETYMAPTRIEKAPVAQVHGRGVHGLVGEHLGAGGYALDRETAKLLVALSGTIERQVDDFLFDPDGTPFRRARVHQMVPAVCIQGLKLARLRRLGGDASAYASQLYAERLTTRRKLGLAAKVRRELLTGLSKGATALVGHVRNLAGPTRWGRIPFR